MLASGKTPSFGEEFITYETVCSRGRHLKFIFVLKGRGFKTGQ
jgi:hypothetical protein